MHARILLPSLVAATLLSTAAWADRNDNDDRTPNRTTSAKERIVKESRTREVTERVHAKKEAPAKARSERAAPPRLAEKRGCATEDGGSCSSKSAATQKATSTKTSRSSMPSMPARLQAMRGCTTDDGSGCTGAEKSSSKTQTSTGNMTSKHLIEKSNRSNQQMFDQMMKMRLEIEAKRILDMLKIQSCKRSASCTEDPY